MLVALVSACTPSPEPSQTSSQTPSQSVSPTQAPVDFTFYYAADTPQGLRLFPEVHQISPANNQLAAALDTYVSGGEPAHDSDYLNLWGTGSSVNSVVISGTLATVDLAVGDLNLGSESEGVALATLVWTVTAFDPNVTRVQFTVNGVVVESLAGHVDLTQPLDRQPASDIINPVTISSPVDGFNIMGEVVIQGMACTFEAVVAWELKTGGKKIESGSTLASEACPAHSPWSLNLGVLPTGSYVFRAFELSAKDGSLLALETREFTVTN